MTISRRTFLQSVGSLALLHAFPAVARAAGVRVYAGPAFGSTWRLVLPDTYDADQARARLLDVVARIDRLMSPYRPNSELARFNRTGRAALSRETGLIARAALALATDSDGAFDPTTAPLGRRYGFGPIAISPTRPAGRFRDIRISGDGLESAFPGLTLDLCGIAKGYALDEVVRALDGLEFLVELGGEVAARGRHPAGRPWRIGIERPGTSALQRVIHADWRACATSGPAWQSYTVGRRSYSHVIDPRLAAPVENGIASVSVLAPTGLLADGLATAAMVLGPEAAGPLLETHDASALFLLRRGEALVERAINGFPEGGVP